MPFTTKQRKTYQNICHLTERGVLVFMKDMLKTRYDTVYMTPSYVVAIGDLPIALVAHADTVFRDVPRIEEFYYDQEKDVIWNSDGAGADDRAGIYSIVQLVRTFDYRPHIIITTGEESGCIGAIKLTDHFKEFPAPLKFLVQLDRRGYNDSVYYDCENPEFEKFINGFGFETQWGSFTDISELGPAWKVAAVNLSIGYLDEHQEKERLHVDWMHRTIAKVADILQYVKDHPDMPKYDYIPGFYTWHRGRLTTTGTLTPYWYDYDSDFDYYPESNNMDHCLMCQHLEKKADMLPVWYQYNTEPHYICMDCFGDVADEVVFCEKCNRAIYLSPEEVDKIPDRNHWICEECKNESRTKESTETV